MSIQRRYNNLKLINISKASGFGSVNSETVTTFKGLIQTPSNSNAFINAKDTSAITGLLFTDIETAKSITSKALIEDVDGTRYIVSGQSSQPNGVTGITPRKGQHAEFSLVYANKGLD